MSPRENSSLPEVVCPGLRNSDGPFWSPGPFTRETIRACLQAALDGSGGRRRKGGHVEGIEKAISKLEALPPEDGRIPAFCSERREWLGEHDAAIHSLKVLLGDLNYAARSFLISANGHEKRKAWKIAYTRKLHAFVSALSKSKDLGNERQFDLLNYICKLQRRSGGKLYDVSMFRNFIKKPGRFRAPPILSIPGPRTLNTSLALSRDKWLEAAGEAYEAVTGRNARPMVTSVTDRAKPEPALTAGGLFVRALTRHLLEFPRTRRLYGRENGVIKDMQARCKEGREAEFAHVLLEALSRNAETKRGKRIRSRKEEDQKRRDEKRPQDQVSKNMQ